MQVFVARQPIYDAGDRVVGYELLHREGPSNRYRAGDDTLATRQLLSGNVLGDDGTLAGGVPAWINFPAEPLLDGSATLVDPADIVVELLETVAGDAEVLAACADLLARGYHLAADDVSDPDDPNPLLDLVGTVKVDFQATSAAQRRGLARRFSGRTRLLVEKVETRAEQQEARGLGFGLLQGYYLQHPEMLVRQALDRSTTGVLQILDAVAAEPLDFTAVEAALKQDVAITDQLLRYLNSAFFRRRQPMTSVRAALVALGEQQVRRWVTVTALSSLAVDQPPELVVSTLVRARMCEGLAPILPTGFDPTDLFLTGLYSQFHLLVGLPFREAVTQAPVPPRVALALLEGDGPLAAALELVIAYEQADWPAVAHTSGKLGTPPEALPGCYAEALSFADGLRTDRPPVAGAGR